MSQIERKCPSDGNLGIPIEITGAINNDTLTLIKKESPVVFQFMNARSSPMTFSPNSGLFDESPQNTVLINNDVYRCIGGQVCLPGNTIYPGAPGASTAEICLWFSKNGSRESTLIIIPIYTTSSTETITNQSIGQRYLYSMVGGNIVNMSGCATTPLSRTPMALQQLFDSFVSSAAFTYTTCIDLKNSKSIYATVLYFPNTFTVQQQWWNRWRPSELTKRSVPVSLYIGTETVARYRDLSGVRIPSIWSNIGQVDTSRISANSSTFIKRFTYYESGYSKYASYMQAKTKDEKNNAVSQYKCVRLNPDADITDGYVTIDPLTGRKQLDSVLNEQNQEVTAEQLKEAKIAQEASVSGSDIGRTVGIVIGLIGGIIIIGLFILWLSGRGSSTWEKITGNIVLGATKSTAATSVLAATLGAATAASSSAAAVASAITALGAAGASNAGAAGAAALSATLGAATAASSSAASVASMVAATK